MLTDTTFWIDLTEERIAGERGRAHRFMAAHRAQELRVSIVTWGELAEGYMRSGDLDALLLGIRILMLPVTVAWEASRIQRELCASGCRIGENDAWIAGTARAWGLRLVTRDEAFGRVARLNVVRY